MGVINKIKEVQEAVNTKLDGASIQSAGMAKCSETLSVIRGSGSPTTEVKNAVKAAVGAPANVLSGCVSGTAKFCTGQPLKAVKAVAGGLIKGCTDVAKVVVSPIPTALAVGKLGKDTAKGTFNAGVEAVKWPPKAALRVFDTVANGVNNTLDLYGPGNASSAANDNAKAAPAPASTSAPIKDAA